MILKPVIKGLLTFVPGANRILPRRGTGGTDSASYCYGVWLKHLTYLAENGMTGVPRTLAELGPGDSLGIGLAAMLCGVDRYIALDIVEFSTNPGNLEIFDELVELFRARAPRPNKGWPDYDEFLDDGLFPGHILTDKQMASALRPERVAAIRRAVENPGREVDGVSVSYVVPWSSSAVIEHSSVDLVISHSVLEHVADPEHTYEALKSWLKPQGRMTHQIDLSCHNLAHQWNGHRSYPEWLWKIIEGKRDFLINREPCSVHLDLISRSGFQIDFVLKRTRTGGIRRDQLDRSWASISEEDLDCSELFLQAIKN